MMRSRKPDRATLDTMLKEMRALLEKVERERADLYANTARLRTVVEGIKAERAIDARRLGHPRTW